MNKKEAVNWIINITADIGKSEHRDLWHYEQALSEIREMLESEPERKKGHEEIIRCKDCKNYSRLENEAKGQCMARFGWFPVDDDWFCADGERKDDDGDA